MNTADYVYCSFIVKVWTEEAADEAGQGVWRGHITHVPSGDRRYIKGLDEIAAFIARYLKEMGARPSSRPPFRRWLKILNLLHDPR